MISVKSKISRSPQGPANFVSAADKRAEDMLCTHLLKARPGYGFIGEEGGTREGTDSTNTWIVDPLDGTTNFLHGIPQFAISIALQREGAIVAGVVYNPANDELYIAERGKGAFLNDHRLRVADARNSTNASLPRPSGYHVATTNCRARKWPSFSQKSRACAALERHRSIWRLSRPDVLMAIGSEILSSGISRQD
ncbi:MAG: inositol monophosphatase family protein [Pseudomonas sp.]